MNTETLYEGFDAGRAFIVLRLMAFLFAALGGMWALLQHFSLATLGKPGPIPYVIGIVGGMAIAMTTGTAIVCNPDSMFPTVLEILFLILGLALTAFCLKWLLRDFDWEPIR